MTGSAGRFVPGARIGDYRLVHELPARDLAFLGAHVTLPRRAKLITPATLGDAAALPLLREAYILEAIRHPAVPRIYECGELPDRRPWIAVELLAGPTVAELAARRPVAVGDVATALADCSAILAHAHARDVTHRGVHAGAVVHTADGLCMPDWSMAVLEARADRSADIRALGAMAYRLMARAEPSISVARRCPNAPARMARLVDRMVAATAHGGPTAADVRAETALLHDDLARTEALDDGTPIEQVEVVLVDISRDPPPVPRQAKLQWTPQTEFARITPVPGERKKTP